MTTLRPFGPSVTFTASARMLTPRTMRSRASPPNFTSLVAILRYPRVVLFGCRSRAGSALPSGHDAHDVRLLHDQVFVAVDLDLGARPLAEQDAVARFDIQRLQPAGLVAGAGADGHHFAFLRLFLGGLGDDDAAEGLRFLLDPFYQNAVLQRLECRDRKSTRLNSSQ